MNQNIYIATMLTMMAGDKTIKSIVRYVSPGEVIRLTRRGKPHGRMTRREYVLTIGVPNYLERVFIKQCKKAGEAFPVKKMQIRHYPKKR